MIKPNYKTWIRTKAIVIFSILVVISLSFLLCSFFSPWFLFFIIPTFIFSYILLIISLSKYQFSTKGGNYQAKIHSLIVQEVTGSKILDIGCGSGHLLSQIAKLNPEADLTGIDYWGENWEYSKELCENNFHIENISNKYTFRKETASNLPEDIGRFDCIVSCLTFHEVNDVKDKTVPIAEALMHLRHRGKFVFFDLFQDRKLYPDYSKIEEVIRLQHGVITKRYSLSNAMKLPFPLNHKKVLRYAEIIIGEIK